MHFPDDWEEYNAEEEGTYAFFNVREWTGNFRISPLRYSGKTFPKENKPLTFLEEELANHEGAKRVKLGELEWVHYKKEVEQDSGDLVMYHWSASKKNILFLCSFTVSKSAVGTEANNAALETVEDMIKSIKVRSWLGRLFQ